MVTLHSILRTAHYTVLHRNNTRRAALGPAKATSGDPALTKTSSTHTVGHGFRCMMDESSLVCHGPRGPAPTCTAATRARGGPERTGSGRLGDDDESHKENARAGRRVVGATRRALSGRSTGGTRAPHGCSGTRHCCRRGQASGRCTRPSCCSRCLNVSQTAVGQAWQAQRCQGGRR